MYTVPHTEARLLRLIGWDKDCGPIATEHLDTFNEHATAACQSLQLEFDAFGVVAACCGPAGK